MDDNFYTHIISPIVIAVIGGVGYLVKYILARRDKKHEEEIAERNRRRDEIELRLSRAEDKADKAELKADKAETRLNQVLRLIIKCKHPDCPTKVELSEMMDRKTTIS